MQRRSGSDDDDRLTLRVPVRGLALVVAAALHVVAGALASLLPEPKPQPQRIEIAIAKPPPAPAAPPAAAPAEPPQAKAKATPKRAPAPAPVVPVLPPSQEPPASRAQLPVVERSPAPVPPPEPSTWQERLESQLAATRPKAPKAPTGVLAPRASTLDRVAAADARLHDEATERRLIEDHGAFFRRGLEALRGHWHPGEVLDATERDPARRCGRQNRTTYAVAVLDKEGNVVDVDLKAPSGCPDLDDEAMAAFKRVARFPFPPEGIFVAPDGSPTETARYPVRFIVAFDGGLHLDWR